MNETDIQHLVSAVKADGLSRRGFVETLVGARLTAPMAAMLLMHAGVASAQSAVPAYKPTKRGGGGALKLLLWQGPHAAEPAFRQWHQGSGGLQPVSRAAGLLGRGCQPGAGAGGRIPSRDNGGVAADGKKRCCGS